eukprot:Protomagalhaensia_wolfi_Nauph_80__1510@NODE_1917_length_1279_cov_4499_542742_g752_i1_p1_GENE_NODE_1917_length_1279_cov_4499_542742_g752_i1NODE_1917_length_1279_cov_4499_542742_g752_i1_p1_ORF_typecomplete_len109_score8_72DUF3335/PF11814_8/0_047_NODE_1917_length_1279_cov_4499_542742_g752_i17661092
MCDHPREASTHNKKPATVVKTPPSFWDNEIPLELAIMQCQQEEKTKSNQIDAIASQRNMNTLHQSLKKTCRPLCAMAAVGNTQVLHGKTESGFDSRVDEVTIWHDNTN